MVEFRTEKIFVDGDLRDKMVAVLSNGAKIVLLSHTRELDTILKYSDQFDSFEFLASRWDENLDPRNYWEVFLGSAFQTIDLKNGKKITMSNVQRIAENISLALLRWPPAKREQSVPICEVRFLMTPWGAWRPQNGRYLKMSKSSDGL